MVFMFEALIPIFRFLVRSYHLLYLNVLKRLKEKKALPIAAIQKSKDDQILTLYSSTFNYIK